ncbi:TPA: hypothetical protein ACJKGJ_002170, partial [Neisseria meningitidis]
DGGIYREQLKPPCRHSRKSGNLEPNAAKIYPKRQQSETFAKFLSLTTAETQTQVFVYFRPKYLLILPKYPLNPPRIPDNQASGRLLGGSGRT